MTLLRPAPWISAQVLGVARRLEAAGFEVVYSEVGGFAALRRDTERGLRTVARLPQPAVLWLGFAGWPLRHGTLAELRAWLDTFG